MNKEFFEKLMKTYSPSGYETEAIEVFNSYCESLGAKHEFTDHMGNSCYSIGTGDIKVMISAHIDELGYQVQRITKEGMIQFVPLGGVDKKTLPGSIVWFPRQSIKGIIGKKPIHVEESEERGTVDKINNLLVDVGAENKEDLEGKFGIEVGDVFLPYQSEVMYLGENRIVSRGLDDKIGIYVVTQVLKELIGDKNKLKKYTIYFVANTQEEVGLRGAMVTSKRISPDISIDLDVTFATDEGRDISEAEEGEVSLGEGPVICYGPDKNSKLTKLISDTSVHCSIPTQKIAGCSGGTNTSAIQEGSLDCMTALISIPNRNMHTPVEMCDIRDIDRAVELVCYSIYDLRNLWE